MRILVEFEFDENKVWIDFPCRFIVGDAIMSDVWGDKENQGLCVVKIAEFHKDKDGFYQIIVITHREIE